MKVQIVAITTSPILADLLEIGETSFVYGKDPKNLKSIPALETDLECFVEEGFLLGDLWSAGFFPEE